MGNHQSKSHDLTISGIQSDNDESDSGFESSKRTNPFFSDSSDEDDVDDIAEEDIAEEDIAEEDIAEDESDSICLAREEAKASAREEVLEVLVDVRGEVQNMEESYIEVNREDIGGIDADEGLTGWEDIQTEHVETYRKYVTTELLKLWRSRIMESHAIIHMVKIKCLSCGQIDDGVFGADSLFDSKLDSTRKARLQIRNYGDIYKDILDGLQVSAMCKLCEKYKEQSWQCGLLPGDHIDVNNAHQDWCESVVLRVDMNTCRLLVHYLGWGVSYNQWIDMGSSRIARGYTMVQNWREGIAPGYPVEIMYNHKWYVGVVTSINADKLFAVTMFLQYNFRNKFSSSRCGVKKIIKNICIDSETICKKGIHIKLTNSKMWEYVDDYWDWYRTSTDC
jgi:hypothetical protein